MPERKVYDPRSFACAPGLRLEAQERMAEIQFAQLNAQLSKIEGSMDRLEKRLWLTVYGVTAVILVETMRSLLHLGP